MDAGPRDVETGHVVDGIDGQAGVEAVRAKTSTPGEICHDRRAGPTSW